MSGMTGGDITTLTGNAGGLIPASGSGNFNIVGSGSIVVTGAPATHTLTISGGGVTGMTEHAMVVGNAAGGITSLAVATDGQLPIGSTGNNPVLATLTAGNNIGITNAAGSITIKVNGTTNHALQVGNVGGSLTSLVVGGTGVILQGNAGTDPSWSTATYPSTAAIGDVLVASAANVIGVVAGATTAGHILTANGAGTAPTFQAPPAGVTYASDAETIAGTVTNKAVAPSNLKAKLGLQTVHALPVGNSDSLALDWLAVGGDGTVLIGNTGADPSFSANPTVTTIYATTFDTNVVAAGTTLSGTTLSADGTDVDIDITVTPKGAGDLVLTTGDVSVTSGNLLLPTTTSTVGQIQIGGSVWGHAFGGQNVFLGFTCGNTTLTTAGGCVGIGYEVLNGLTTGILNFGLGNGVLKTVSSGKCNSGLGTNSGRLLQSGNYNFFGGSYTAPSLVSGSNNVLIGTFTDMSSPGGAGGLYTGAESSNICILNVGVAGESNKIRIGTQGSGAGQQNAAYIAGIYNTAVGATAGVVLSDSDGKLGGLAGAANTIFVGGTKPSFTATPQCTDLTLTGNLYLSNTSSTVGRLISGSKVMMHFYDSNATYYSNTFIGWKSGNYTNTSSGTICIGLYTGNSLSSGTEATIIGNEAGRRITSGNCNLLFGSLAGTNINTGKCNVVVTGRQGLDQITTGNYNLCLGHSSVANPTSAYGMYGAGHALTTSDSSNILIQAYGTSGWSNVLKIGDGTGTNAGQINTTYICGIYGKTPVGTMNVALVDSNNQLGSTSLLTPSLGGRNTIVNCTSSNSVTLAVNTTYIATSTNGSTKVVFTLPSTSAVGDEIKIIGASSAYYEVDQNSGNTIFYDNAGSTPGATGKLDVTASHRYTSITLTCITTDANWVVSSLTGAITLS